MRQNRKQDTVKTGCRSSVWSCSVHPLDTYVNFGVDVGVFTRFETGIIYPFRNTHRQKTSMLFFSRSVVCNSLWPHGLQHARLLCLSLSPGVCSDSRFITGAQEIIVPIITTIVSFLRSISLSISPAQPPPPQGGLLWVPPPSVCSFPSRDCIWVCHLLGCPTGVQS